MIELNTMLNIGKEMTRKLKSVDIHSAESLIQVGSKEAYLRIKERYPNVCLVHLYVLEGAILNLPYNALSEEKKKELKEFADWLK